MLGSSPVPTHGCSFKCYLLLLPEGRRRANSNREQRNRENRTVQGFSTVRGTMGHGLGSISRLTGERGARFGLHFTAGLFKVSFRGF